MLVDPLLLLSLCEFTVQIKQDYGLEILSLLVIMTT